MPLELAAVNELTVCNHFWPAFGDRWVVNDRGENPFITYEYDTERGGVWATNHVTGSRRFFNYTPKCLACARGHLATRREREECSH